MSDTEPRLDPFDPEQDPTRADAGAEYDSFEPAPPESPPSVHSLDQLLNAPAALDALDEPLSSDETPLMPVAGSADESTPDETPAGSASEGGWEGGWEGLVNDPLYDQSISWARMEALAEEDSTPSFGLAPIDDDDDFDAYDDEFEQTPSMGTDAIDMDAIDGQAAGDTPPFGIEPIGDYSDREAALELSLAAIDNLSLGSTASETWALEEAAQAGDGMQFGADTDDEEDEPRLSPIDQLLAPAPVQQSYADVVGFGTWGQPAAPIAPERAGAIAQPEPDAAQLAFEQLTLAEMFGQLRREPRKTTAALMQVLTQPPDRPLEPVPAPAPHPASRRAASGGSQRRSPDAVADRAAKRAASDELPQESAALLTTGQETIQLVLRLVGFGLAVFGTFIMQTSPERSETQGLDTGLPFLVIGFIVWLLAEGYQWAVTRGQIVPPRVSPTAPMRVRAPLTQSMLLVRGAVGVVGTLCAILAALLINGDNDPWNLFTLPGVLAWFLSIACFAWVFAPAGWNPVVGLQSIAARVTGWRPRLTWVAVALLAITVLGAGVRLYELEMTPREMTSDHVEMLLDTLNVQNGQTNIFFANNGGREAFQFYALALFSKLPGQGLNFETLKLLNVIESILSIPILFWFGCVMIGPTHRRLGIWVGLGLAAWVAVSLWHLTISRMAERIVLTPAFTALILIFFIRGLRSGRRGDFIGAGLMLGAGLYTYQVLRMLPVVIGVGILIALFLKPAWATRRALLGEFAIIAALSLIVFVPLLSFSVHHPEDFWRRSSGRLFGDDITQDNRASALQTNLPILANNVRNALLMYHWRGDVAWIQNAPGHPALDPLTGGLMIVGLAAWAARMLRRREAGDWLIPATFLILILPSALALAYPVENPSATRMSGTLPIAYLWIAFPAALMARSLIRLLGGFGRVLAVGGGAALIAGSLAWNAPVYFNDYDNSYANSAQPYSDVGGVMQRLHAGVGAGAADSTNPPVRAGIPYGNMFIIAYPYWWDHRAVGIAAGAIGFPNALATLDDAPAFLRDAANRSGDQAQWRLDVNSDLIFLYNPNDTLTDSWLRTLFPTGTAQLMLTYQAEDLYYLYRVPALGQAGFDQFLTLSGAMSDG